MNQQDTEINFDLHLGKVTKKQIKLRLWERIPRINLVFKDFFALFLIRKT